MSIKEIIMLTAIYLNSAQRIFLAYYYKHKEKPQKFAFEH